MWFPHSLSPRYLARAAAITAAAVALLACGPFFPNRLLLMGDAVVLSTPIADFRHEIDRLTPKDAPPFRAVPPTQAQDVYQQSAAVDPSDLRTALGPQAANADDLVARYSQARSAAGGQTPSTTALALIPPGLPAEFDLYLRGFIESRSGHTAQARTHWEDLLALPPGGRHWRSVWAAFMLGKSFLKEDPDRAVAYFRRTRDLAAQGCSDNLGLASSSLGWEARAELDRGQHARAARLYLEQHATGDPTALMSLCTLAGALISDDKAALEPIVQDQLLQRVVTAYLVARGGPRPSSSMPITDDFLTRWLAALERTGAPYVANADRLAWTAYQAGRNDRAQQWLALAPADSGLAQWLRAKYLLRAGKLDEAAAMLAKASAAFPDDETWDWLGTRDPYQDVGPRHRTLGEAGVILMARRHYTEALDALLRAGYWGDAAYIAERVLTADELKAHVDRTWPATNALIPRGEQRFTEHPTLESRAANLRYLLARRLVRLNRFDEARPYMPEDLRPKLQTLATSLREGRDPKKSAALRASALWTAATITRQQGMELLGTELAPDAAIYDGSYPWSDSEQSRQARTKGQVVGADPDELQRAAANHPDPDRRFHYRFVAAQLGWDAAQLMPDQDPATAEVLCTAGRWIKDQDRDQADRFYKAMVRRCGKTALGAEADRLRWFPNAALPEK